jgi:hypothetical protein
VTSSSGFGASRDAAVVVAFATTVLLWRIYIYRAGEILGAAVAAAPDPLPAALSAVYAHPVMVAGLAAVSPAMIPAPPLLAALAAAIVLAGVAIADTARARRHPGEPPSPPSGSSSRHR